MATTRKPTHRSFYTINNGTRFPGIEGYAHNSVLHRTKKLFSGEGYYIITELSWVGHVVLRNSANEVLIEVELIS